MRMMIAIAAAVLSASVASGQCFNIDLGGKAGGPAKNYEAWGNQGVWTVMTGAEYKPKMLMESTGLYGTEWVAVYPLGPGGYQDLPYTTGSEAALLDDYLGPPATVVIGGLERSRYQVLIYSSSLGKAGEIIHPIKGIHPIKTTMGAYDGTLTFEFEGPAYGLQICTLPTDPLDWNLDGLVNSDDLLMFIQDFEKGEADFNGDGVTDSIDFLSFLSSMHIWMPANQCDYNCDGKVNSDDFLALMCDVGDGKCTSEDFLRVMPGFARLGIVQLGDYNCDGKVNSDDYLAFHCDICSGECTSEDFLWVMPGFM